MTYLLNISFFVEKQLQDAFMTWLNDKFVPVVADPAIGFEKFEFFKLISPVDKDHVTICLQLRYPNHKYIDEWLHQAGFEACDEIAEKYKDAKGQPRVMVFPTLMESID